VGAQHQILRDGAVEIGKVDHQFDAERQLFAGLARADADGGGDVAVGGDLDLALTGDFGIARLKRRRPSDVAAAPLRPPMAVAWVSYNGFMAGSLLLMGRMRELMLAASL